MYTKEELKALEEMENIVYAISNLVTGRVVYVGKTTHSFNKRYGGCDKLGYVGIERVKYATRNKLLKKQIEEYGTDNFKVDIVYNITQDEKKLPKRKNREEVIEQLLLLKEAEFVYKNKCYYTNGGCNIDCDDMFRMVYDTTKNKNRKEEILKEWIIFTIKKHQEKYGHIHYAFEDLKIQNGRWNKLKKLPPFTEDVPIMLLKLGFKINIQF